MGDRHPRRPSGGIGAESGSGRGQRICRPVVLLGVSFFGLFFILYNIAVSYTTAARASLALCTLPLLTMVVGAVVGREALTARKSLGVILAVAGATAALASGLADAPQRAWIGELIMVGAVLCMAVYNVYSRPFIQRSSALGFLVVGMGAGAAVLIMLGWVTGRITRARRVRHGGVDRAPYTLASAVERSRSSSGFWLSSAPHPPVWPIR